MPAGIRTAGGDTTIGGKSAPVKNPAGPAGLATAIVNSGNRKTGITLATYASQASCPDGNNNSVGFRCPLYNSGCYAEAASPREPTGFTTNRLNKAGGVNRVNGSAEVTPEQVATDEAAAITAVRAAWQRTRKSLFVRLHVVGDCVTTQAVKILGDAAKELVESVAGGAKNVWNYTHAWRSVPRSAWPSSISVLASVDSVNDLAKAHSKGYGCAIVVDTYTQQEGKKLGVSYQLSNGFTIIPCPYEVERILEKENESGRRPDVQCITCKLCLKDDFLHKNKLAIAFAAHGSRANKVVTAISGVKVPAGKKGATHGITI